MPEISMTTFVDFVIKSGNTKITCVREAKEIYSKEYRPAFDYWKRLRESIIDLHQFNKPKSSLDKILNFIKPSNQNSYRKAIISYKKWLGNKSIHWIGTSSNHWNYNDLTVRVNPELGISFNGSEHLIKLYFKGEAPSKIRLDTMLHLLNISGVNNSGKAKLGILEHF